MSFDSIHGNTQYFSDFFIFFTFDKTQPHNFSTTIRELIDPIHNLPDQFFMFGIVGLGIEQIFIRFILFVPGPYFQMIQVVQ